MGARRRNGSSQPRVHDSPAARIIALLRTNPEWEGLLGSPLERLETIKAITPESYEQLAIGVNALIEGRDPITHGFDAQSTRVASRSDLEYTDYQAPHVDDRPKLIAKSWEAAQRLVADENLSVVDRLRTAALELSGVINLVHGFKDANGRTGRAILYLIDQGFLQPERQMTELDRAVAPSSADGRTYLAPDFDLASARSRLGLIRREIVDMGVDFHDTRLPRTVVNNPKPLEPWDMSDLASLHAPADTKESCLDLLNDNPDSGFIVLFRFTYEHDLLDRPGVLVHKADGEAPAIDARKVISVAAEDGTLEALVAQHRQFRYDVVDLFIDELCEPSMDLPGRSSANNQSIREGLQEAYGRSGFFMARDAERGGRSELPIVSRMEL